MSNLLARRRAQLQTILAPLEVPMTDARIDKNLPRSPLTAAERTEKLLGMRWSAPVASSAPSTKYATGRMASI